MSTIVLAFVLLFQPTANYTLHHGPQRPIWRPNTPLRFVGQ